jgi:4-hydroxymandelate oxidase
MNGADDLRTLADLEAAARDRLDPARWSFVEGGAGDEVTLAENRAAFRRWRLHPRVLTGGEPPSLATTVAGIPVTTPILVAPFAGDTHFHPDGFAAVLRACAARGTLAVVPELTTASLGELAAEAPDAARIFQLSLLGTVEDFTRLAGRAEDAGYAALCVTVDAPVAGVRRRTTPARADSGLTLGNFEPVTLGNFGPDSGIDVTEYFGHVQRLTRRDWSWADLAAATATTGLPFIVKGILGAADARAAVDAGAAAVYVSNHGGRQLDAAPATLDALEEVVAAVGGDAEVLLDGGIRSGTDVVMALALGARAVLIGRPAVMGLAAAGQAGVARILEILDHEVLTTMTLLGRAAVRDLDRSVIRPAPGSTP